MNNNPYETTTLPYFRVAGISKESQLSTYPQDIAELWQNWNNNQISKQIQPFSQTIYCVFKYHDNSSFTITLGKLITTDLELPEHISEVWIPPQVYAYYTLPEKNFQAAIQQWQQKILTDHLLPRRQHIDFEAYPSFGEAKIYVSLEQKVKIKEQF